MRPITDVASDLDLPSTHVHPWGPGRAKLVPVPGAGRQGKLVLVSAITPTPNGEGKTTMAIALAMGLRRRGRRAVVALRQPSMGPVFGKKGGGTGGGRATIEPSDTINLHFTGDLHAVGSAHDLLASLVDHALEHHAGPDPRRVRWPRVLDVDDKALRRVIVGLEGVVRETSFDITAASEVMAVLGLAEDRADLEARLGRLIVGEDGEDRPVTAADLQAVGAMSALLRDALLPNLVQTAEGGPALVHGGPFANIAHGCSTRIATRLALAHSDVVLTEAGFGFDLGGEKYLHIKAAAPGLWPDTVALVVTWRALAWHGEGDLGRGLALLGHHLESVARFGLRPVVVLNRFPDDPDPEPLAAFCAARGVAWAPCAGFAEGGAGSLEAADALLAALEGPPPEPRRLYPPQASILEKLTILATSLYAADGVELSDAARRDLARIEALGGGALPVCVAKTPLSLSDDPKRRGLVRGHVLHVRGLRLHAGAGFVVALAGDVVTMPGLPKEPAAWKVRVEPDGRIRGLMQED